MQPEFSVVAERVEGFEFDESSRNLFVRASDFSVYAVATGDEPEYVVAAAITARTWPAADALGGYLERSFSFGGTLDELSELVHGPSLAVLLADPRFKFVGDCGRAAYEPDPPLCIRTPGLIIRCHDPDLCLRAGVVEAWEALTDGEDPVDWLAGDLEALDARAVAALGGRQNACFEFTGPREELIVLAWGSSLADLMADPRFRIVRVHL